MRRQRGGLFGASQPWDIDATPPPWGGRPSIYAHVRDALGDTRGPLPERAAALPDEALLRAAGELPWAPGAMDGVLSHHEGGEPDETDAEEIFSALRDVVLDSSEAWVWRLYGEICERRALFYVDPLVRMLADDDDLSEDRLYRVGRWLATQAADREAVKAGIAVLGLFRSSEGHAIVARLGHHDEFSLYAGVALSNTADDGDGAVWDLARAVHGWGRIHLVEHLIDTDDDRIKAWLIRQGYRNTVLIDYLAHACASAGDLRRALDQPSVTVDDELRRGSADLIEALLDTVEGGPAPGIDDYVDAGSVVDLFMRHCIAPAHMRAKAAEGPTLRELHVVQRIALYLRSDDADWDERRARGWTDDVRDRVADAIDVFLAAEDWPARIQAGLESDDMVRFILAAEAAPALGIDAWEHWFRRLERGENTWVRVSETTEPERMERLLAVAQRRLPAEALEDGPPRLLGLPIAEHTAHAALMCLLAALQRFPGKGGRFMLAGLKSPVAEVRLRAADALADWPADQWPPGSAQFLREAASVEADDDVRGRFEALIATAAR